MSIADLSPHSIGGESDGVDPARARILDAALQQFEDVGIRRTTIEDIARRAGVERVTVYRRIGSQSDVVQAVVSRESLRTFESLTHASATGNFEDRIATAFTTVVRHMLGPPPVRPADHTRARNRATSADHRWIHRPRDRRSRHRGDARPRGTGPTPRSGR